jgi:hypothetical protein
MDENVSKSTDRGEKYENKLVPCAAGGTPVGSNASVSKVRVVWCDSRLRDVWSPKLNVGEGAAHDFVRSGTGERTAGSFADTAQDGPGEAAAEPASHATLARSLRLAMFAAPLAALLAAFVGSLSAVSIAQFWPHMALSSSNVAVSDSVQAAKNELAELSALKMTDSEGALRNLNNPFARLSKRLDRTERVEADLNAKLAHIAEVVDRLEKARDSVKASDAAPP